MFQQVCWHGYLDRKCRDRQVNLIFDLLINNELYSGQIGDLLELVKRILANASDSHYKYWKQPYQELVEEELIQRRQLAVASIVWILVSDRGHWTLVHCDPITSTTFHDDLLGLQIPADLLDALQWQLCDLRKRTGEPPKLPRSVVKKTVSLG